MADTSGRERPLKEPYTKPELRQVSLRPDEAVLGNCKTASTSGPIQALCTSPTACSSSGS